MDNQNKSFVEAKHGILFYVTERSLSPRYGIYAVMESDTEDKNSAEGIFFTKEEAVQCCEWLAENEVYPITLTEVLADLHQ